MDTFGTLLWQIIGQQISLRAARRCCAAPGDPRAYQLAERPSPEEVLAIAEAWRPYRTLASAYLFAASSAKGTLDRTEP